MKKYEDGKWVQLPLPGFELPEDVNSVTCNDCGCADCTDGPPLEERVQRLEDLLGKLYETTCTEQAANIVAKLGNAEHM